MTFTAAQTVWPAMVAHTAVGNMPLLLNMKARENKHQQLGLAYLGVLFLVAAIAISMAVVSQQQHTQIQREKEQDWLFIGKQYSKAIQSYYQQSPNGLKTLPNSVDDLVQDKRFIAPTHHLRKAYLDPLTNQAWEMLINEENQLLGVASTLQKPLISTKIVQEFQAAQTDIILQYSDVKFAFKVAEQTATQQESESQVNNDELESGEQNLGSTDANTDSLNSQNTLSPNGGFE